MPDSFTGRCNCGAITAEISAAPMWVRQCWCRKCQTIGCGSGTVNALFAADAIHMTGDLTWSGYEADSGNQIEHGFCAACGTQIVSRNQARPKGWVIRAGFIQQSDALTPDTFIWLEEAPGWVTIPKGAAVFDRQPPAPAPQSASSPANGE